MSETEEVFRGRNRRKVFAWTLLIAAAALGAGWYGSTFNDGRQGFKPEPRRLVDSGRSGDTTWNIYASRDGETGPSLRIELSNGASSGVPARDLGNEAMGGIGHVFLSNDDALVFGAINPRVSRVTVEMRVGRRITLKVIHAGRFAFTYGVIPRTDFVKQISAHDFFDVIVQSNTCGDEGSPPFGTDGCVSSETVWGEP